MYKNFNITEEEKQQIMESHQSVGYKQPKTALDEQGILRSIKNMISPEVKVINSDLRNLIRDVNAPESIKQLMAKYGIVEMTDFIRTTLRPVEDEMAIISNDVKRLQQYKKPPAPGSYESTYDVYAFMTQQVEQVKKVLSPQNGKVFDFIWAHKEIESLDKFYINLIIETKQVSPQGMTVIKNMRQNINDALRKLETSISQVATRR